MTFDELHATFISALARSRLRPMPWDEVKLDLRSLDREVRIGLDPDQRSAPLHVGGELSWRWDALHTARARTSEEDVVGQLLGPKAALRRTRTEPRWLRLDVRLWAGTEWGRPLPDPGPARWRSWRAELDASLDDEGVLVDTGQDEGPDEDGLFRFRGYRGLPEATMTCDEDGRLWLRRVQLEAWQALDVPRRWSDERRRPDRDPALEAALDRIANGLDAWSRSLRHLLPQSP